MSSDSEENKLSQSLSQTKIVENDNQSLSQTKIVENDLLIKPKKRPSKDKQQNKIKKSKIVSKN
jgi:hypothetical protein